MSVFIRRVPNDAGDGSKTSEFRAYLGNGRVRSKFILTFETRPFLRRMASERFNAFQHFSKEQLRKERNRVISDRALRRDLGIRALSAFARYYCTKFRVRTRVKSVFRYCSSPTAQKKMAT